MEGSPGIFRCRITLGGGSSETSRIYGISPDAEGLFGADKSIAHFTLGILFFGNPGGG